MVSKGVWAVLVPGSSMKRKTVAAVRRQKIIENPKVSSVAQNKDGLWTGLVADQVDPAVELLGAIKC